MRILLTILILCNTAFAQVKLDANKWTIINHTLVGNEEALRRNTQDTTQNVVCGTWTAQPYDGVYCFNVYNNHKHGGTSTKFPLDITVDLGVTTTLTRVKMFIGTDAGFSAQGNHIRIYTGTPYVWQTLIGTITDNGTVQGTWQGFNVNTGSTSRYIHIVIDGPIFPIGSLVVVGSSPVDVTPDPVAADVDFPADSSFAVNIAANMGWEKLTTGRMYAKDFKLLRQFEWLNYMITDTVGENFRNLTGLDEENNTVIDTLQKYTNHYIALNNGVTKKMWPPWIPYNNTLEQQLPIDYQLGNGGDTTAQGYRLFNNIGVNGKMVSKDPASYAHSAWIFKRLAQTFATRPIPMNIIEPGNELDGYFMGSSQFLPDMMAAYLSAVYDGHEGTLTYNGQTTGIKNCGYPMRVMMPGLAVYDSVFIKALLFWFKHNRTDGKFAADFLNTHSYPNTSGAQGFNGVGLPPESPQFDLKGKMQQFKRYGNQAGVPAMNTEMGYDTYPYDGSSYCNPPQSFMNTPNVAGQGIDETQGNMVARTMLLMRSVKVPFFYYWLADRDINKRVCGTFQADGLLNLDTIISYSPTYSKRPAYYYYRTIDSMLRGKQFVSDTLYVIGSDSIRIQKYREIANPDSLLFAIWSPTVKNTSVNYTFYFDTPGYYKITKLGSNDAGVYGDSGVGSSTNTAVTETPLFLSAPGVTPVMPTPPSPVGAYIILNDVLINNNP